MYYCSNSYNVISDIPDVIDISANYLSSALLTGDGKIYVTGLNNND